MLILIGVMIYSAVSGGFSTIPETLAGIFVTPFQSFATSVSNGVSGFFGQLTGSGELQERIEELEKENTELRNQMVDYDELKQTNDWYSEILGLHEENPEYTFAAGRVIGREPSDYYGNFTISAGQNAGVSVNDPVVSTDGSLVGVVEEVGSMSVLRTQRCERFLIRRLRRPVRSAEPVIRPIPTAVPLIWHVKTICV